MANQNRRPGCPAGGGEPAVTRHSHPIRAAAPCAGDMCWIRGTLHCHSQMLAEILELLRSREERP